MKKITFFLFLLTPLLTFSQVYDFNSDTVGTIPANVTEANGTIEVSLHPTEGQAMEAQTITSGNTAVFNMDLFTAASDYSVTWKETYTTARRDGFILRGNGSNSVSSGLMQGYLFQVSSSAGHARIYRSDASSYTQLVTGTLAASGINTPRWYKATVNGNSLILDYSTDGITFTNLLTTTDNTYTTGNTQYVIGYSSGVGGMYVDDVTLAAVPTGTIYDFESDTVGVIPANVTEANGTVEVSLHPTEGQAMEAKTITSGNTAFFNMDLFTAASDYSVTWKETYTTARRDGFILRGNGSNSIVSGLMQGYLFQVSSSAEHARIYRSDASSFAQLAEVPLTASGINTPRWYKATVNGNSLTLDYSTDGSTFTNLISITDNTYTAGKTQYTIGYGVGVGGMYVDDVTFAVAPLVPDSTIYDFESDTVGVIPANVTEANGTAEVSLHPTEGQAMEAKTITSGSTAIINMDLFTAASDYSVTWKETYTTARRNGFILRGNGSSSVSSGLMQGYLFQVSATPTNKHVRIYKSGPSSFGSPLASQNLEPSGIDTPRWYRATVNGSSLTLDYSTDGIAFNNLLTTTDNTYTAGNTQYTIGYGSGVGGMYVDDVTFQNLSSDSVSINNISPYQVIQRDGSGNADILVEGVYTGTPTTIEARWNGNATWTTLTLDANGAGTFSGTLENQSQGQGLLEVQFSNDNLITDSVTNVGIGDIFIIAGQSNASGRGTTLNSYSHVSLKATLFGNDDTWKELADAVDSSSGQIDAVSSDASAAGTPWPLLATSIMASQNIPVAFVPTPKGGTSISQWQPGTNHSDASTLYGSMNRRITAVGGNVKAILFFQGESDASAGTTQANYETRLNTFINTIESDFTGLKTVVGQIGHSNNSNNFVRAAQINVLHTNSNAILGPVTYDIDLSDEGGDTLHFKSDADMTEFATRWYKAIEKAFYSGTNGYGPIVDEANVIYNSSLNKITVPFTDDTTPVINPLSTVTTTSFDLKNNGVSVVISSLSIVDNTIELTPSTPLNTGQTITLSYALDNAGVNAAIYDNETLPAENFYNIVIDSPTLGVIENTFANDLLIYPNPTDGNFSIDLGENYESIKVKIINSNGQIVQLKNYNNKQLFNLNIESNSAGVYILLIESGDKKSIIRLLKK